MAIPTLTAVLLPWEEVRGDDLGEDDKGDEPSPGEEREREVVPEGDKGEDNEGGEEGSLGAA